MPTNYYLGRWPVSAPQTPVLGVVETYERYKFVFLLATCNLRNDRTTDMNVCFRTSGSFFHFYWLRWGETWVDESERRDVIDHYGGWMFGGRKRREVGGQMAFLFITRLANVTPGRK